jgi:hypothetical protein
MSRRDDDTAKIRIVPFGPIDAETIAEFAYRTGRRTRAEVEVLAPRRLEEGDPRELLERAAETPRQAGVLSFGLVGGDRGGVTVADRARGVGLVTVPARRALDALLRLVDEALEALAPEPA